MLPGGSVLQGSMMLETLQILNLVIVIATGFLGLLVIISKPFRRWLLKVGDDKKKEEEREINQRETDKCLLRDRITSIYFKNCRECEIKEYEFENVAHLYKQYKALGGNSFVDKIWREMQEWRVIP